LVFAGSKPSLADGKLNSFCPPSAFGLCVVEGCCPVKEKCAALLLASTDFRIEFEEMEYICEHLAVALCQHL
jgi:hypothetical protein